MAPVLTIRLLGPFEARIEDAPLPNLHRREGERLLAYLALHHGGEVAYPTLARLFWPSEARDHPGEQGDFTNTRQAIRWLRRALGAEAARLSSPAKGIVCLDLTNADVDLIAFDRLVAAEDLASWQTAFALYRGPLLQGWSEPWVEEARARRKRSYERLVSRLIAHARAQQDHLGAATYLRAAVEATPLDETLCRELMQALAQQRSYEPAAEVYERLCLLLQAQGKKPEAATEVLMTTLRQEARSARAVIPAPLAAPANGSVRQRAALRSERPGGAEGSKTAHSPDRETVDARPQVALLYKHNAQPDDYVVRLLERELTQAGYRVFIDRHLRVGIEWANEIERQMRASAAVVPLLSEASLPSEMLAYEIELADRAAQAQGGWPRLLPVRVGYRGPLPELSALAAILNPLQYALWQSPEDDRALVTRILQALQAPPVRSERLRLEPAGGAVTLDSPFYIERPADAQFKAAIARQGSIVLVKGARQMGKTSLLVRGLQAGREAGARVVHTDFQALNLAQLASPNTLLLALATACAVQLDLDLPTQRRWNLAFSPNMNLELFLRRKVLGTCDAPLVWGIDEVDRLFDCPFSGEVFGLFRSLHNLRSFDPEGPWSRLTLAIAYATEAHRFITDPNQSPFNVGTRLTLEDFTPAQVEEMNRRYGAPLRDAGERERFYRLVSGQPYLVQRGLNEMAHNGLDLVTLETQADREEGPFGDHLRRMLASLARDSRLIEVMRALLSGSAVMDPDSFYRLRSAGIVRGSMPEDARVRCQLYASYLGRHLAGNGGR